jgi:ribosomal protein L29
MYLIFFHCFRQQSLEDLSSELIQMRKELHRLLEIIQSKDRVVQDLESRLRKTSDDQITKYVNAVLLH